MLKEALEFLTGLGRETTKPHLLPTVDERRQVYLLPNGNVHHEPRRLRRRHEVHDLASLAMAVERFDHATSIWVSPSEVVAFLCDDWDNGSCTDAVLLPLHQHPAWIWVQRAAIGAPKMHAQRDFVRLLRTTLADTWPQMFLEAVRRVSVSTSRTMAAETQPGRERGMGEFHRELADAGSFPDVVELQLPAWTNYDVPQHPQTVRCVVELDLERLLFGLAPIPGDVQAAETAAVRALADKLEDALAAPVLCGEPMLRASEE